MLNNIRRFTTSSSGFISAPNFRKETATASNRGQNFNFQTLANLGGGGDSGGYSAQYAGNGKQNFVGMLDGFLPETQKVRNSIYRDIYKHDAVAGGAADIYATMPFSDFYLTGLKERDAIDVYHKSVEKMRMKIMLPAISIDYMVIGRFVGTTVFNNEENMFSAIMPQNSNNIDIQEVPIYGMDPLINLRIDKALKDLLKQKNDPRIANIIKNLPDFIRNNLNNSTIPLDPATTLFIPRRTDTSDSMGTSYFERILPIHIMEKAMWRGTADQMQRRQRAILHITVSGDGDDYVPTIENLESINSIFKKADEDPTGAIITTHSGVQPNEIRSAADFFRIDEVSEYFNSAKYKALGISEAMITGEANFNAMDATLSLFIEQLRAYRTMLTREIFYEKIFPAIAVANDFYKDRYTVTSGDMSTISRSYTGYDAENREAYAVCAGSDRGLNINNVNVDVSELAIPHVSWSKHLRPEGDSAFFSMLNEAKQAGVPIPLAMMASATGVDLNSILNNLPQEVAIRKRVQAYNDKLAEFGDNSGGGDDNGYQATSRLLALAAAGNKPVVPNFMKRDYPEHTLPHEKKKSGSMRITSKKRSNEIYDQQIKVLGRVVKHQAEKFKAEEKAARKMSKFHFAKK